MTKSHAVTGAPAGNLPSDNRNQATTPPSAPPATTVAPTVISTTTATTAVTATSETTESSLASGPEADQQIAAALIAAELAARDVYAGALDAGADDASSKLLDVIRKQHQAAADQVAGISGIRANTADPTMTSQYASGFDMAAAAGLETSLVEMHTASMATISSAILANAVASIAMIEARQAASLSTTSSTAG